jgi:hypothetical protein
LAVSLAALVSPTDLVLPVSMVSPSGFTLP